ncbi:MAG: methylenetetrahydrofolate reductase [NAD(P)H] [Clostridiales bacterium]|nr:methylenetetrahydrofolate reductase [NAD(P)H] [Clostridiales bacterium]
MKISEILANNKITVSFEMFPPKQWDKIEKTKETVHTMAAQKPSFISVTYGAAGTRTGFTSEIANEIKKCGETPLYHLTCLTSTKEKIDSVLSSLQQDGIENVLALRGDIPENFNFPDKQYFHHAYELVKVIKQHGDFCVGAACYPEVHPESKSAHDDLLRLKEKTDCGVDFLTTQMFFDNDVFFDFKERCKLIGIKAPIIAGIMPITNASQINRSIQLSGCRFPKKFSAIIERFGDNAQSMKQAGVIYALEQIVDLIANGQNNIHIYTMNKGDVAAAIMKGLSDIINE